MGTMHMSVGPQLHDVLEIKVSPILCQETVSPRSTSPGQNDAGARRPALAPCRRASSLTGRRPIVCRAMEQAVTDRQRGQSTQCHYGYGCFRASTGECTMTLPAESTVLFYSGA